MGVGVGWFVTNDCCFSRFFVFLGVFFYFLTDLDVIEWEKRSEWAWAWALVLASMIITSPDAWEWLFFFIYLLMSMF